MAKLPSPPPEIPSNNDLATLAPLFGEKVWTLLSEMTVAGYDPIVVEAFRSDTRQRFLYGFGREYDDGRGVVTNAMTGAKSWHRYGLAVDVISKAREWDALPSFWTALKDHALELGLMPGAVWQHPDRPHVQWHQSGMPITPTDDDWDLLQAHGMDAVWRLYGAVA
jgi:hypothetical protein